MFKSLPMRKRKNGIKQEGVAALYSPVENFTGNMDSKKPGGKHYHGVQLDLPGVPREGKKIVEKMGGGLS